MNCEGTGQVATSDLSVIFGVARCPVCGQLIEVNPATGALYPHLAADD